MAGDEVMRRLALPPEEWAPPVPERRWWEFTPAARARHAWAQELRPLGLRPLELMDMRRRRLGDGMIVSGRNRWGGRRRGREVRIEVGERSVVQLLVPAPSFQLQGRARRLHATGPLPREVEHGIAWLDPSDACDGLTLGASDRGISVRRRTISGSEWASDLWIAEYVADLLSSGA